MGGIMKDDAEARQLLDEAALPDRSPLIDDAAEYLRRTRLGRRCGLIGGLVLGFGPLAGDDRLSLVLPRMFAGYVLGLLVSESLAPRRGRPARRAADLRVRRAGDLLPSWARVMVWALFIPALASPLLTLVHPVRGLTHISMYGYSCDSAGPQWPGLPVLAASAAIGAAGLLVSQLTLARLARRPRPADDLDGARLDDLLRGMSARAVAGGAAALALVLVSGIGAAVYADVHSFVCPAHPGPPVPAYPWAASLTPWLQFAPLGLLAAAFIILAACRRRRDPRHRPVPSAAR
jgi:hypothetical protein